MSSINFPGASAAALNLLFIRPKKEESKKPQQRKKETSPTFVRRLPYSCHENALKYGTCDGEIRDFQNRIHSQYTPKNYVDCINLKDAGSKKFQNPSGIVGSICTVSNKPIGKSNKPIANCSKPIKK